ncbi:linker for activation of T-cells family member 1 [Tachyglossus aculeatus]|uniref:linker for activation of T-cells family member 1 n=1 Tax=Tachyglossus aculeatus TaxID=9261 RepID=UPI0018F532B7|nr:linker for activation of T-cells family member 1 [Tachyglossus aculeatus]
MESISLNPGLVWLFLLLFLLPTVMVTALCLCCRDLPDSPSESVSRVNTNSQNSSGLVILKRSPYNPSPWSVVSHPPVSHPDLLPVPRSPQNLVGSLQNLSVQPEPDNDSVPSYENESPLTEAKENKDEDGYLEVLPEGSPIPMSLPPPSPALPSSSMGPRDSASSMVSEEYENVPETPGESLGGSSEYVNVPEAQGKEMPLAHVGLSDCESEEERPDYENLQERNKPPRG